MRIFLVKAKAGPLVFDGQPGHEPLIKVWTHDDDPRGVTTREQAVAYVQNNVKHHDAAGTVFDAEDVECVDGPVGADDPRVTPSPVLTKLAALAKSPKTE